MNKQTGFTLIELIMVIVILGILAATALPKFVNLSSDARTAAVQALEGSMRSANSIIYAKAAVNNQMGAGPLTGVFVGPAQPPTTYGFAATAAALSSVMDTSPSIILATTGSPGQFQYSGAALPASCGVTYTAPSSSVGANSVPTYVTVTTGC